MKQLDLYGMFFAQFKVDLLGTVLGQPVPLMGGLRSFCIRAGILGLDHKAAANPDDIDDLDVGWKVFHGLHPADDRVRG